jgi:toxin ParE1/3/4
VTEIKFLPEADIDYREALVWYEARSTQAAIGFEAAFGVGLTQIAEAPERWTRCDESHRFYSLRRYPFSIVYRIETDMILVVAVAHARRSGTFWKGRGQRS